MPLQVEPPTIQPATTIPTDSDRSSKCCGNDSLQRRVWNFLHCREVPGVDELDIAVDGNTVTLRGILPSQNAKRLCLDCCRHVAGVVRVIDNVTVEKLQQDSDTTVCESSLTPPRRPR